MAGRGAYLHDQRSCWEKGMKGALEHALRVELTLGEREGLLNYANSLPVTQTPDVNPPEAYRPQESN
jgi:predicted RNA-binding protein YlxR (DUF448 family)